MTSWYTTMQLEEPKPVKQSKQPKTKQKKTKAVVMVTPTSAENARQIQLAKKS